MFILTFMYQLSEFQGYVYGMFCKVLNIFNQRGSFEAIKSPCLSPSSHFIMYVQPWTMYNFIPIHSSVISCPNKTKFAVQVLAYQRRLHTRFKVNYASHSWDMSLQKVVYFLWFPFFPSFRTLAKSCHKMQAHNQTHLKMHLGTKFGLNTSKLK